MTEEMSNIPSRVSTVEAKVGSLGDDVHALRSSFEKFAEDVRQAINNNNRTDWGTILTAIALISGFFLFGIGPLKEHDADQDARIEANIERTRDELDREIAHHKELLALRDYYVDRDITYLDNRMNKNRERADRIDDAKKK